MQFLASVVSVEHDLATVKVGGKEAGPAVGWPYARGLALRLAVELILFWSCRQVMYCILYTYTRLTTLTLHLHM